MWRTSTNCSELFDFWSTCTSKKCKRRKHSLTVSNNFENIDLFTVLCYDHVTQSGLQLAVQGSGHVELTSQSPSWTWSQWRRIIEVWCHNGDNLRENVEAEINVRCPLNALEKNYLVFSFFYVGCKSERKRTLIMRSTNSLKSRAWHRSNFGTIANVDDETI